MINCRSIKILIDRCFTSEHVGARTIARPHHQHARTPPSPRAAQARVQNLDGLLIYSISTAWSNIRSLCPRRSSCNSPEREHRNSLRLCAVVLPWQLTIRSHKQTVDNLVVGNLSNPDHTTVASTSCEYVTAHG